MRLLTQKIFPAHQQRPSYFIYFLGLMLLLISLTGCATIKDLFDFSGKKADVHLPPETLIAKGLDDFNVGRYDMAEQYFTEILDRHPFSAQAILAELKAADCKYYMGKNYEALVLYKQFEDRHPTNEIMPYVMYQKAMCNYNRIDTVDRDPEGAVQAIQDFTQLLKAYPVSPYTEEATARIKAAKEFLVNHEYFIVEFYLRTEKYKEAETRLRYIIAMYPDAKIIPRAKDLLAKLEEGKPPHSGFAEWFSELSLPSWKNFIDRAELPPSKKK
ncbi:MAG: outer membrane protein assembly factor BamD [Desulfocapsaceae bacterium]|nr:outer membrane protein assembly factor BamD [Desulfocapsaceae bacterium]